MPGRGWDEPPGCFHPEAEDELHDGTSYHDAESSGLGNAFLEDLEHAIVQIIQYPESSPFVSKVTRLRAKPENVFVLVF